MSQNSSDSQATVRSPRRHLRRWLLVVALPLWVLISFIGVNIFVFGVLMSLSRAGVLIGANEAVINTVGAACVYVLTLTVVMGIPWLVRRRTTTKTDVGLSRMPSWQDIVLAPAGFLLYLLASGVTVYLAGRLMPWFDGMQTQQVGFDNLTQQYEFMLAFITLVVIAPIAEEMLFRGYLYGKLRKTIPVWGAILITSVLFGVVHGQWNVGIDVFVLSVMACILREVTGSIWAGILLHMIKNGLAFYILFINTSFLVQ
jgi:membrane protease YdiL (CAAX protease family)